ARREGRMVLAGWGHEVREAADGEEALRVAGEFLPDVVILDLAMPRLGGLEVARRLRQGGAGAVLIALTGHAGPAHAEAARAAGLGHFLLQPWPPGPLPTPLRSSGPVTRPPAHAPGWAAPA